MYFYNLRGYEENTVIQHNKVFSKEEFQRMCKEAPLDDSNCTKHYNSSKIVKYLKKRYGFQELKMTAGFFVDNDVE